MAKINQHNEEFARGEVSWKMSVNHLADLTHDEFMEMNKLMVPDMPKATRKYQMQAKSMASSVDWRDQVNPLFSVCPYPVKKKVFIILLQKFCIAILNPQF